MLCNFRVPKFFFCFVFIRKAIKKIVMVYRNRTNILSSEEKRRPILFFFLLFIYKQLKLMPMVRYYTINEVKQKQPPCTSRCHSINKLNNLLVLNIAIEKKIEINWFVIYRLFVLFALPLNAFMRLKIKLLLLKTKKFICYL